MSRLPIGILVALVLSLAIHTSLLSTWTVKTPSSPDLLVRFDAVSIPVRPAVAEVRQAKPVPPKSPKDRNRDIARVAEATPPATLSAPAAPSAEDWRLASTYTLKNSKRYRHNWGQQVRSMMGTAVEGPDQGMVRFRIEIAPDGKIAKIEELWSTSEAASKRAWQAIRTLPPLPPTPTGKPLVFEQTISFMPYETGWPPSYKHDCLPDPPTFNNPFAWDGTSAQPAAREQSDSPSSGEPPPTDCPTDSTADSIEEEEQELKRQMERNRWGR